MSVIFAGADDLAEEPAKVSLILLAYVSTVPCGAFPLVVNPVCRSNVVVVYIALLTPVEYFKNLSKPLD
jgi:hypothetical protein